MGRARFVLAMTIVLVAACGPGRYLIAKRVTGPDGTRDFAIVECRIRADCLTHIADRCIHGYDIINDDGRASNATMLVRCPERGRLTPRAAGSAPAAPVGAAQGTGLPSWGY